jgi:universal stress protein A
MNPLRSILAPLDFSEHSREALRFACTLARRLGASLTLLHVYQPPAHSTLDDLAFLPPQIGEGVRRTLEAALQVEKQGLEAEGVELRTALVVGAPFPEIIRLAAGFDLIVMGTKGRTGLRHALLGSVAERVVRYAPCPVLTVRPVVLALPAQPEAEPPPGRA